ncbi:MAG: molybdopterin-dependent oxidoreductase, partial [Georgfuchsia sp.]
PQATLEELALAGNLVRGIGSDNIDFRLRQSDFSLDGKRQGTPWLGMKITEINQLDRVLVVGSFLRKDQPLIAQRLRQASKRGTQVSVIHSSDEDLLLKTAGKLIVSPSQLPQALAEVVKAVAELKGIEGKALLSGLSTVVPGDAAKEIAVSLVAGQNIAVLLGNFAQQHPQAAALQVLATQLATLLGGKAGFLGEAANSVGGYVAKALPAGSGLNAARMLTEPLHAYLLLHVEPELDCADGSKALTALNQAKTVIVLSPFKSTAALKYADVLLPIAPFSETSGSFINTEGRVQSFYAVNKPQGEARPAWKVLRVLGNLLNLNGFEYESSEDVRNEIFDGATPEFVSCLNNNCTGDNTTLSVMIEAGIERVADVPVYFADALVRRAPSLQKTKDAAAPAARMNAAMLTKIGATVGNSLRIRQGAGEAILAAQLDAGVPNGCVRIAAAHQATAGLGAMHGVIIVEVL